MASFRRTHGLEVFIETGCYLGDGVNAALLAGYECVFTCDICEKHADQCRTRFPGAPVTVLHADSLSFLGQILALDLGPALFWLDAHFPSVYGLQNLETEATRYPLREELDLIRRLRAGAEGDLILFDDVRVIFDSSNKRWRPGEVSTELTVTDFLLKDLVEPFQLTHTFELDMREEGIGMLLPKRPIGSTRGNS